MPKKTASIRVNHIFGTKASYAVDLSYRGKRLKTWSGHSNAQELLDKAKNWAHFHNFTHVNVTYG